MHVFTEIAQTGDIFLMTLFVMVLLGMVTLPVLIVRAVVRFLRR